MLTYLLSACLIGICIFEFIMALKGKAIIGLIFPILITLAFFFIDFGNMQLAFLICSIVLWVVFLTSVLRKCRKT